MENYVLYEELRQGTGSRVYKGRRRGTTDYVAVHCIDKSLRSHITNTVRLTHDIIHKNVVQFHEWYETSNHLWLVTELCVGGTLHEVITQDGPLPEKAICKLGIDLARGLHHLHSLRIVFSDFSPTKIVVDSPGTLKYSDFSSARMQGEDLASVYFEAQSPSDDNVDRAVVLANVNLHRTAPEILIDGFRNIESDLYSFGMLLYEMFTGCDKNVDLSDANNLFSIDGKQASENFRDLICGLLQSNPSKRLTWDEIISHSFWQGGLMNIEEEEDEDQRAQNFAAFSQSEDEIENFPSGISSTQNLDGDSLDGIRQNMNSQLHRIESKDSFVNRQRILNDVDESKMEMLSANSCQVLKPAWVSFQSQENRDDPFWANVAILLYHSSDLNLSQLSEHLRKQTTQWESKSLPVAPLTVPDCLELTTEEFQVYWERLLDASATPSVRSAPQRRIHILNYMASIIGNQALVTRITGYETVKKLVTQLKATSQMDIIIRLCHVISLVTGNMTYLEKEANVTTLIITVADALRSHFRELRLRHSLLIALGELIILVARMEYEFQCLLPNWVVPSLPITLINRCLQECDQTLTNHCAAKLVENIASIPGRVAQSFSQTDIVQSIWFIFTHSTIENIRVTAISVLCRMALHSIQIFHILFEKLGLPGVVEILKSGSLKVQQAMLTIIGALLVTGIHASKVAHDKDFLQVVLRLLDSSSTVLCAKVFLVIAELVKLNRDVLVSCCQTRIVMYIERNSRRQTVVDSNARLQWDYMYRCIELLASSLCDLTPAILGDIISVLKAVQGRKHPNTSQSRLLRTNLPLLPVILHFITSQVFRPRILTEYFFADLGNLFELLQTMENGESAIDFACGGNARENLTSTTLSILEAVSQHPACMDQFSVVVASKILSPLATLIVQNTCDGRLSCLKIFTDIVTLYLSKAELNVERLDKKIILTIHQIISTVLLPHMDEFLQDHDPLPSHTLHLLQAIVEQSSSFVHEIERLKLAVLFFKLLRDHNNNPLSSTVQSIVGILSCMVCDKSTNVEELYKLDFIQHMTILLTNTSNLCVNGNSMSVANDVSFLLLLLLDTLMSVLNHVADVVRKTLQAQHKNTSIDPEMAEHLLVLNKPLVKISGNLAQLLCHSDCDIQDHSCRLLSLLVQLYGAECHFALLPEHVDCFGVALQRSNHKKQKVLIKTLLRLVTAEPSLSCPVRDYGKVLISELQRLAEISDYKEETSTVPPLAVDSRSSSFYSSNSYDQYIDRSSNSTIGKMQQQYWVTKHAVLQKLGKKEDKFIVASDAELDAKLELFHSIEDTSHNLQKVIELYQDKLLALSQEENCLGRFLKEQGKLDKTRAGKMMTAAGKSLSYTAQQRLSLRVPLVRLHQEVETFRSRAISDTFITVTQMEGKRTEYRGALHWMKDVSQELDPDTYKQLEKFRKVQSQVRRTKSKFDKLKIDCLQKIDLLAASRCNMFSHALATYQNTLLAFWKKTSKMMTTVAECFKGYQHYEFSMLKELTEPSRKLAEETGNQVNDEDEELDKDRQKKDKHKKGKGKSDKKKDGSDSEVASISKELSDTLLDLNFDIEEEEEEKKVDGVAESTDVKLDKENKNVMDLLSLATEVDDNELDDLSLLREILSIPQDDLLQKPLDDLKWPSPTENKTEENDFLPDWQSAFGQQSSDNSFKDFLPSQLLDTTSSVRGNNNNEGGIKTNPDQNKTVLAASPATNTKRKAPLPNSKKNQGKDMSAWFNLFADLDPLSNPDAIGKSTNDSAEDDRKC
uniref:Protein kinase domain-containing protein n=1 Tax=Strigamia maritima TaxID=126957 RepID=T1J9I6_STRMM